MINLSKYLLKLFIICQVTATNSGNYDCNLCKKKLLTKSALISHNKKHSKIARCICNICGKIFLTHKAFNAHMKRELGEKKFSCIACNASFAIKTDLQSHTIKVHKTRLENLITYNDDHLDSNYNPEDKAKPEKTPLEPLKS